MRCEFRTEDDDEAAEHARDSGHMRCICCRRRFLTEFEPQTCAPCIGRVRADLADLAEAYTLLPADGTNALALLGDGTMQRHMHAYEMIEPITHPLLHDDEPQRLQRIRDEWLSDPFPVIAALASWEDFWRADYGDPTGPPATLHGVVDYLTSNLDTRHNAAQTHHAFDEFAAEVRRLRSHAQGAAGLADVPLEADVKCFDCRGELIRRYRPPSDTQREHRLAVGAYLLQATRDVFAARRASRNVVPVLRERNEAAQLLLEPRVGLAHEGLAEEWECRDCGGVYTQAEYYLACRAALEARAAS